MQCDGCDEYNPCMSSCPKKTCDNKGVYDNIYAGCDLQMCVEGCESKVSCPNGEVLRNNSKPYECVKEELCPFEECYILGRVFSHMDVIKDRDICSACENW